MYKRSRKERRTSRKARRMFRREGVAKLPRMVVGQWVFLLITRRARQKSLQLARSGADPGGSLMSGFKCGPRSGYAMP